MDLYIYQHLLGLKLIEDIGELTFPLSYCL